MNIKTEDIQGLIESTRNNYFAQWDDSAMRDVLEDLLDAREKIFHLEADIEEHLRLG